MSPITIGRHLLDPFRVFDNLLHSNNNKVTSSASKSLDTNMLKIGADSVVITASAWHAGGLGSVPERDRHVWYTTWLSTLGTVHPA